MTKRQVVVTGLGVVSPLGLSVEETWQNILVGKSGIKPIEHFDASLFSSRFAGTLTDFEVTDYMSAKDAKKCDIFIQYGIAAATQAVVDSGLDDLPSSLDANRIGVSIGSGIGGLGNIESHHELLEKSGPRKISPFFIPATIINLTSGHVSMRYGFKGPNLAMATACTTGTHAIGLAARSIVYGDADVMVAGGSEKASTPLGMGGFAAARALSTRNDDPTAASRPWDQDRDGFVLGDGGAVMVLEEKEHAIKRGARIYGELLGFGMSGDAYHITMPSGDGAKLAMRNAINDAKINPEQIGHVNAHATSTKAGDIQESLAIEEILGSDAAKKVLVSGTKSMTGHLLGAAGAIEAIFTVLALRSQISPPTMNLENIDEDCNLNYCQNSAIEGNFQYALSNSFGFGGTNGSLIFKKV